MRIKFQVEETGKLSGKFDADEAENAPSAAQSAAVYPWARAWRGSLIGLCGWYACPMLASSSWRFPATGSGA